MSQTPYIVQRSCGLYLCVRVPADIVLLAGRTHIVKSLRRSDLRRARAEAAIAAIKSSGSMRM